MFEIVTRDNSQHITLNDNLGRAPTEAFIIGRDVRSIWRVICGYADRHCIMRHRVGYAVRPLTQQECDI
jgi:hypothetical protein